MRERGSKSRSARARWQAITTWLNWCVGWGLIRSSPAAQIKAPKVPKTRKPFLTGEQFASLLQLCPLSTFAGARRQSMLRMMATTGIRRNEMWMLKKQDLDWDHSVLRRTLPLSTLMKGFSPDTLRRMRPLMPPKRVLLK